MHVVQRKRLSFQNFRPALVEITEWRYGGIIFYNITTNVPRRVVWFDRNHAVVLLKNVCSSCLGSCFHIQWLLPSVVDVKTFFRRFSLHVFFQVTKENTAKPPTATVSTKVVWHVVLWELPTLSVTFARATAKELTSLEITVKYLLVEAAVKMPIVTERWISAFVIQGSKEMELIARYVKLCDYT